MCRWASPLLVATLACALAQTAIGALPFGFGEPATPGQIAGWDIDVRPDGRGLPPGHGSVAEGRAIYDVKCAACHGTFGESNSYLQIAGGVGSLRGPDPVRTTGSKLNYATTLFDYIRRAMPLMAPQSLTAGEVYALTAYVLNLNDIVGSEVTLDATSLAAVRMPNRDGFSTAHGMLRRDGVPDTHNSECMRNCAQSVSVTSSLPAYARDAHGDVASQMRSFTHVAVADAATDGRALARSAGCIACHAVDARVVGPSFRDVAAHYRGDSGALARLRVKLRDGGSGVWGGVPMPAQTLPLADAQTVLRWILDGAP